MTVARSEKVLLQDIYVNNTSEARDFRSNVNTDGIDTGYLLHPYSHLSSCTH